MKLLILFLIFCLLEISCQNNSPKSTTKESDSNRLNRTQSLSISDSTHENFINYWKEFRTSVLNNDTSKIIELTHFPFQTRGPLDDDPTVSYNKNQFTYVFNAFLNQSNGEDFSGIKELDDIKKNEIPNKGDIHNRHYVNLISGCLKGVNFNLKLCNPAQMANTFLG